MGVATSRFATQELPRCNLKPAFPKKGSPLQVGRLQGFFCFVCFVFVFLSSRLRLRVPGTHISVLVNSLILTCYQTSESPMDS